MLFFYLNNLGTLERRLGTIKFYWHIYDHCSHYIETGQLIFSANQLTGFYMMEAKVVKGFKVFFEPAERVSYIEMDG